LTELDLQVYSAGVTKYFTQSNEDRMAQSSNTFKVPYCSVNFPCHK